MKADLGRNREPRNQKRNPKTKFHPNEIFKIARKPEKSRNIPKTQEQRQNYFFLVFAFNIEININSLDIAENLLIKNIMNIICDSDSGEKSQNLRFEVDFFGIFFRLNEISSPKRNPKNQLLLERKETRKFFEFFGIFPERKNFGPCMYESQTLVSDLTEE